ncbi:MAG: hypothetical protein ABID63_07200 [Pseudomonadota bacterium]
MGRWSLRIATAIWMIGAAGVSHAAGHDQVLYHLDARPLKLGKFGAVSAFQQALYSAAAQCGGGPASQYGKADGVMGENTRRAVMDVLACPPFANDHGSGPASKGAITVGMWRSLMPDYVPLPDAIERANQLTFALEGTDYDRVMFNFCQSRNPRTGKTFAEGDRFCYSNDRKSYMTWGPRGATAGHGAEIQQIMFRAEQRHPDILKKAFGPEFETVIRLILGTEDSVADILCAAWINPERREALRASFARFGSMPEVQEAYREVYDAANADGGKIRRFFKLYQELKPLLGRDPTEIDLAFFIDRATHGSTPPSDMSDLIGKMSRFITRTRVAPTPGQLRMQLAAWLPSQHKFNDRLARDAIFLIDDPKITLSDAHKRMWQSRSGLKASSFGLSDDRFVADYPVLSSTGYQAVERFDSAHPAEKQACPAVVKKPQRP